MKKILIVEDTPAHWSVLKDVLSDENYKVFVQDTVEGAIQAANDLQPDLIILDLWIPIHSENPVSSDGGWRFTKKIRSNLKTKNIPIILTTAFFFKQDKIKAKEYNIYYIIQKPFDTDDVLSIVREVFKE